MAIDIELKVFVYGTLKPEEINDWVYGESVVAVQPAIAYGQLYALPLGYPAMTPPTDSVPPALVYGFLLSFSNPAILSILDEFEQHDPVELVRHAPGQSPEQNQYQRKLVEVFDLDRAPLGLVWTYTMTHEQVQRLGGILLTAGKWSSENAAQAGAHKSTLPD